MCNLCIFRGVYYSWNCVLLVLEQTTTLLVKVNFQPLIEPKIISNAETEILCMCNMYNDLDLQKKLNFYKSLIVCETRYSDFSGKI